MLLAGEARQTLLQDAMKEDSSVPKNTLRLLIPNLSISRERTLVIIAVG